MKTDSTPDLVYKRPARFSLLFALLQAAVLAVILIGLVKHFELNTMLVLPIVIFLPVLSVVWFANVTRRHVAVFQTAEREIIGQTQWWWFAPQKEERHSFDSVTRFEITPYDGEDRWWVISAILQDDRKFEITAERKRDKAKRICSDLEHLVGCPA